MTSDGAPDQALGIVHPETGDRPWRLGVMGGTFDPIHHGHLVAASEVAARFGLDEVVFVPTGVPWQKAGRDVSMAEDRYLMTVVATASNPRFSVSRVDIDRPGDTYTVDTLKDLRRNRGENVELFFITGADALAKILTWRGAEELFDLAHFIGVSRPGVPLGENDIRHLPADKVTLLEVPAMAISSTDCRNRVGEGLPIWYLVPDGIVQYIAKRGLYGHSEAEQDRVDTSMSADELGERAAAENARLNSLGKKPSDKQKDTA
ncbi:nicotinate-nucleotide adenylyltransferase [Luteococcus sp. H138]|uniref:nicotinate-nucleotide adenylyltransferase n=1 Tax=unclassified Luteococcus TaxID=2639923 RepID=UPI00313C3F66